jgi:PAS domain-containing protein
MRFNESTYVSPGQLDFVPRERQNQLLTIIGAFAACIALIFVLGYGTSPEYRIYAPLFSMLVVAALCFFVVYGKQQSLDLVMSTEYQNMMFAQAASLGSSFCMFVRRDGTIVYANDGLRNVFMNFGFADSQALDGLFERSGVPKTDRERIMNAIYAHSSDKLVFPIKGEDGTDRDYVLTVEPLARPAGYVVVRGREFQGQRAGLQLLPSMLRSTSADKLDHMLGSTPVAHYVTNGFGEFEFVNSAMERMLGYTTGTILEQKMSIQSAIAAVNNAPLPQDYTLGELAANVSLRRQDGQESRGMIFQNVLRDHAGKIIGATGSIVPMTA